jgi:excisionase family DNA binding protein
MREDTGSNQVLTLPEAAKYLRVSQKTLGDMARRRKLPAKKVGREWRFNRVILERWLTGELDGNAVAARSTGLAETDANSAAETLVQYELFPTTSGFRDTAFTENRDQTLHRWVPWIAGYSASFVADVLKRTCGRRKAVVLDPFAGVGTTVVEAMKHGHDAVGFEINPYAALSCQAKTRVRDYDVDVLSERIARFGAHCRRSSTSRAAPKSTRPHLFVSRVPFFSPDVERQVLIALDFIRSEKIEWVRDLFRVAFGSVMVSVSNYSYEPSLGTREAAGKSNVETADVFGAIVRKLHEMTEDIAKFQKLLAELPSPPTATIYPESFFHATEHLAPAYVDVLITSPPYLNNYHYIRNTRPQMFWLELVHSPKDLKSMEQESFGQFWQTVRTGPIVELQPHIKVMKEAIETLRTRNAEKGPYGGPGWANYATTYFNDCDRFCQVAQRIMKPGGTAVVVIGNNILQGIEFPTDVWFAEIANQHGFETVELHEVRRKRTGTSIVNSAVRVGTVEQKVRLYETAVELRRK